MIVSRCFIISKGQLGVHMDQGFKKKIRGLSKVLRYVAVLALFLLPIGNAGYWITNGYPFLGNVEWNMVPKITDVPIPALSDMSSEMKFFGFLVNLIPNAFAMLALFYLAKLFRLYEELEVFSAKSVKCIRHLGYVLLIGQLAHPIYYGLITLTVTIANPPGKRMISLALGTEEIKLMAIAAFVILISWIMDIGRKLQEEQEATV